MPKKKAKKFVAQEESCEKSPKEIPQCTFVEEEITQLVDYFNFISKHAKFGDMGAKDVQKFSSLQGCFARHIKKCEDHIFEYKNTVQTDKA